MKAVEYVEMYRSEPNRTDPLPKVGTAFVRETAAIMTQRKIQDNLPAYVAVIREQADKWRAFARRADNGINEDGFLVIARNVFPMLARHI